MKRKFGILFMAVGSLMVLAALVLSLFNTRQDTQAGSAASSQLQILVEEISRQEAAEETAQPEQLLPVMPQQALSEADKTMKEIVLNGDAYIGYLTIPSLKLELPVMSGWNGAKLQKAPCRFTGTLLGEDLVIMAHNFARHFGSISQLQPGDQVLFTDADGVQTTFQVILQEILQPEEVEAMVAGDFDLTLFTCTYGGQSRITVRCNKAG